MTTRRDFIRTTAATGAATTATTMVHALLGVVIFVPGPLYLPFVEDEEATRIHTAYYGRYGLQIPRFLGSKIPV